MILNRFEPTVVPLNKRQEVTLTYPQQIRMEILNSEYPILLDGPVDGKKWTLTVNINADEEDA